MSSHLGRSRTWRATHRGHRTRPRHHYRTAGRRGRPVPGRRRSRCTPRSRPRRSQRPAESSRRTPGDRRADPTPSRSPAHRWWPALRLPGRRPRDPDHSDRERRPCRSQAEEPGDRVPRSRRGRSCRCSSPCATDRHSLACKTRVSRHRRLRDTRACTRVSQHGRPGDRLSSACRNPPGSAARSPCGRAREGPRRGPRARRPHAATSSRTPPTSRPAVAPARPTLQQGSEEGTRSHGRRAAGAHCVARPTRASPAGSRQGRPATSMTTRPRAPGVNVNGASYARVTAVPRW